MLSTVTNQLQDAPPPQADNLLNFLPAVSDKIAAKVPLYLMCII